MMPPRGFFLKSIFYLWLTAMLVNCDSSNDHNLTLYYHVHRGEFVHKITVFGEVEAQKAMPVVCPDLWPQPKINWLIPEGTLVKKDALVCELDAAEILSNYHKALNELENTRAEYHRSLADLALQRVVLESQVKSIEAAVSISRLQVAQLAYVSPLKRKMIELQIQRAEIELTKIHKKMTALKTIEQTEIARMGMKVKQSENQVNRAKMFLDRLTLKAPGAGIVIYSTNWMTDTKIKEGDAVWGGMPLLQIPEISRLQAKLQVSEIYIKRIQPQQRVIVRVDVKPQHPFSAHVSRVAAMGKPISRDSKIKSFEVIATFDSTDLAIPPGSNCTCDIQVETCPDTLALPLDCVFERDSVTVVYAKKADKFETLPVTLGNRSENQVLVSAGLRGGEILALNEPPARLIVTDTVRLKQARVKKIAPVPGDSSKNQAFPTGIEKKPVVKTFRPPAGAP